MNRDLRSTALDWLASGRNAVVIEVLDFKGSVPRETGTRMLVDGKLALGTIGGGHLEWMAIDEARALLASNQTGPRQCNMALGPALGQCCGGTVRLGWRRLDAIALEQWPIESPRFHLQLYGAGHVGRAIAQLLAELNVSVDWIDEREDQFALTQANHLPWPAHIRIIAVDAVQAEVDRAPPGAYYLVLTHSHDLDLRITEAILKRGDFGYLGLIGSATKRARFMHRFEQRGIAAELLQRVVCPIGVAGIAGKEPEVIAVAVVAQLLQALHPGV